MVPLFWHMVIKNCRQVGKHLENVLLKFYKSRIILKHCFNFFPGRSYRRGGGRAVFWPGKIEFLRFFQDIIYLDSLGCLLMTTIICLNFFGKLDFSWLKELQRVRVGKNKIPKFWWRKKSIVSKFTHIVGKALFFPMTQTSFFAKKKKKKKRSVGDFVFWDFLEY